MPTREIFLISLFVLLSFSKVADAAPTEKETTWVESIFDSNAADDLANLKVCGKLELHSQYLQSLLGAGIAHPRTDPNKITALVRKIQRKADSLAEMRTRFKEQDSPTPEEFESGCKFDVRQAVKHLEALDDFIIES